MSQRISASPAPSSSATPTAPANGDSASSSLVSALVTSPFGRRVALATGLAFGGASALSIPGCSTENGQKPAAVRAAPKEAKFSTIPNDAQIALGDMEGHFNARSNLRATLINARQDLAALVGEAQSSSKVSQEMVDTLVPSLAKAQTGVRLALGDTHLKAAKSRLDEIDQAMTLLADTKAADFVNSATGPSTALNRATTLRDQLYDLDTSLERDLILLDQGTKGAAVAALNGKVSRVEKDLKALVDGGESAAWLTDNRSVVDAARASVVDLKVEIAKVQASSRLANYFAPISDDLGDADRLLSDVLTVTADSAAYTQYWDRPVGKKKSDGQAVVDEAEKLLAAIGKDGREELEKTFGAVAPTTSTASNTATPGVNGAAPGSTVIYRDSGSGSNNMLMWYLLMNRGGGSYPVYTYPPTNSWSYSGSDRLRTSPQYDTFSRTSTETAKELKPSSTSGGLSSRPSTGYGRPSYSSKSTSTTSSGGSSTASTPSTSAGKSGGSFSSKGASSSTSSGGGWLGGSSRSSGSSPGGFGGGSGGRSIGG